MTTLKKSTVKNYSANSSKINKKKQNHKISIRLDETEEIFQLKDVDSDTKIKKLKDLIEFYCGIPYHLQRLHYLDDADLMETTDLRHYDVVKGAVLRCEVWHMWTTLLEAVHANDIEWLFQLGVTQTSKYKTPASDYMSVRARRAWISDRAVVALIMATHRGNVDMIEKLIEAGTDVNGKTPLGRTALHIAAGRGHGNIVDLLLEKGADPNATDNNGKDAKHFALKFGHKDCERRLFLYQWRARTEKMKPEFENLPRMAHQYHDSKYSVWLSGTKVQIYYTNILPPGEYEGSGIMSPQRRHRPSTTWSASKTNLSQTAIRQVKSTQSNQNVTQNGNEKEFELTDVQKQNEFIASLIAKSSKESTQLEMKSPSRISVTAQVSRRSLCRREPNDSEIFGLVELDDKEIKKQRIENSRYGRGKAYSSRIYGHSSRSPQPRSFDDWLRTKASEKRLAKEKLKLEAEQKKLESVQKKDDDDDHQFEASSEPSY